MEDMEQRYSWTTVLIPDPNRPGSPRLILCRMPARTSPGGSSPGSPPSSPPGSDPGYYTRSLPKTPSCSPFGASSTSSPSSFTQHMLTSGSPPGSDPGSPPSSSSSSSRSSTMEQRYSWTTVLIPDPNRPGSPRLILRRMPAPTSPGGSAPGSPPGSNPVSPPSSFSTTSSPCSCSSSARSSSSSSSSSPPSVSATFSPCPSSTSSSQSSPSSSPTAGSEEERWTCVLTDVPTKITLRKLQRSSSSTQPQVHSEPLNVCPPRMPAAPRKPLPFWSGPEPKWVKNMRLLMKRRYQVGSRWRK